MERIRALLVDDEEELITTMVERLDFRGIEGEYALSGSEALEKLKIGAFDVVVIDLKMPGMSGPDLIRVIMRDYPGMPIILMTGHGFSLNGEEIPDGVSEYLPKPVNIEELIEKMRKVVENNE